MPNLCIIPARGGSKRIPRKNIKDFLGKPIIAYSIETALKSGLFDEVMVSTDDEEIAEIAMRFGAIVPFLRSDGNANDFATTVDVLVEVISHPIYQKKDFHSVCCIYPTAPLVKVEQIRQGLNKLIENNRNSVFPAVRFDYPIWRAIKRESNGNASFIWKDHLNARSQDLEVAYHDAGQWYWINTQSLLKDKAIFSENSEFLELDALEVQDIDNISDWKIAELKYELLQGIK